MEGKVKLDRWAEKLLDPGKKNNLINFRDTKASTAEVVFPDPQDVFSKCTVGHIFDVFDPKLKEDEDEEVLLLTDHVEQDQNSFDGKRQFKELYQSKIKKANQLLVYARTPNPMTAMNNISKRARSMMDETGINVAYLAFGFVRWKEKEGVNQFFKAPLLLVHVMLSREDVLHPFRIEVSDDDVVVNPTFNFKLKSEYGLTLPEFGEEDTLASYYGKVNESVKKLGWDVVNECKLGLFSFLKINMYEDLKNNSELILRNRNVRRLLGLNSDQKPDVDEISAEDVSINPLVDLYTVVDADSSQLEAVSMSREGKSFVLQGPPGTGKSQTITNIIAQCLKDHKKVLFVSEKQAALNVVYDKLRKADLADFCLELHSYKANKKAVTDELNRTLLLPKTSVSSHAEDEIRQKIYAQYKLDQYAEELHLVRPIIGMSLYELFERYASVRQYPEIKYVIRNIGSLDQEYFRNAQELLEQYAQYTDSVGKDYHAHPFYGYKKESLSYDERIGLKEDLDTLLMGYSDLAQETARIEEKYGVPDINYQDTLGWIRALGLMSSSDTITPALLDQKAFDHAYPYLLQMQAHALKITGIEDQLLQEYDKQLLSALDGKAMNERIKAEFDSGFKRFFSSDYRNIVKTFQSYHKARKKEDYDGLLTLTAQLASLQQECRGYNAAADQVKGLLGNNYKGSRSDWNTVIGEIEVLKSCYAIDEFDFGMIKEWDQNEYQNKKAEMKQDAQDLQERVNVVAQVRARILDQFDKSAFDLDRVSYNEAMEKFSECLENFDQLETWVRFIKLYNRLKEKDLVSYVDAAIENGLDKEQVCGCYKRLYYYQWIENVIFQVPSLSEFSRILQEQTVNTFKDKDLINFEINKIQIGSQLSKNRPNMDLVSPASAVSTILREGKKKRKQMPIRTLLSKTAELVQMIKPCFLMSPLSVSTFLDPEKIHFDTVIFDEASQIYPQDAIGAIYRGNQLIVVGDSRQMPPSNFFMSNLDPYDEDEEEEDIVDFESILDVCSTCFTSKRLNWHYRSHYEQLIAFSNLNFYDNSLVTFPSSCVDRKGIGVDYYYVDGIFDRKTKTNRKEAEYIVDLVYKHFEEYPERSLGVVAFSVSQQELIDRLITKRREADPSKEEFFRTDRAEPFFVKNLETVQGDERDTIIFSVAYAKDEQGKFLHNFGPLNRQGGERRLNVAVTRAKDNIQLVASIHFGDIDLNRSGAEGVRLLRAYLNYAQNGENALERTYEPVNAFSNDFDLENEVSEFLKENGFIVDQRVGCSGYRIALGVKKPDSEDYCLAIEFDGPQYHESRNARDRDRLRKQVLEKMGWGFYRIWSTDWFKNKEEEKKSLLKALDQRLEPVTEVTYPELIEEEDDGPLNERIREQFTEEIKETSSQFEEYVLTDVSKLGMSYGREFTRQLRMLLDKEGPVSEEFLLKRLAPYFGREKVTSVVRDMFNARMMGYSLAGIIRRNGFLYSSTVLDIKLKVPGYKREIKYISPEELSDGLYTIIKENVSVSKDTLYRTLLNLLGFSKNTEVTNAILDQGLWLLTSTGKVKQKDGMLMVG